MDESIVYINGRKYLFLGLIIFQEKPNYNIISNEIHKTKSPLRDKEEIKYSNVRNDKIKSNILEKIKSEADYFDTEFLEIKQDRDVHIVINMLILVLLFRFEKAMQIKNLNILYDKVSYVIREKEIYNNFYFVKKFEFANSKNEIGVQYADFIVGEAGEKQKTELLQFFV